MARANSSGCRGRTATPPRRPSRRPRSRGRRDRRSSGTPDPPRGRTARGRPWRRRVPAAVTLRGALLTERLPDRGWTLPSWSYAVIWPPRSIRIGSMMARSTSCPLPLDTAQRRHDRVCRRESGDAISQAERRQRRRAVLLAGQRGEPAHRLGQRPEARPGGVRPELAERRHSRQHQARVRGRQGLPVQTPALQGARTEVLDHDVRARHQSQQQTDRGPAPRRAGGGARS